jgi:hypothetical protein
MRRATIRNAVLGIVTFSVLSGVAVARRGDAVTANTSRSLLPRHIYSVAPAMQHDHSTGNAPTSVQIAVDGSLNPNGISDERAYGLFLSAVSSLKSTKARNAAFRKVGLSLADRSAFERALGPLNADLKLLAEQHKASQISTAQRLSGQQGLLEATRNRVWLSLSAAGRTQVDAYIRTQVKSRVKIYRGPSMPSAAVESLR